MACEWDSFGSLVLGGILQQANSNLAVTHYRDFYRENPASPLLWNNLVPESYLSFLTPRLSDRTREAHRL